MDQIQQLDTNVSNRYGPDNIKYPAMIIDTSKIDLDQFMVNEHEFHGEPVKLIQPNHIGTKWTQANKHLRSVVINSVGEVISAGFPKFVNWGENPDNFPIPNSLKNATIVEKVDGSLLSLSRYKGNYIIRTRGTVDASKIDNGHEIEIFVKQLTDSGFLSHYNNIYGDTWNRSYIFEWTSPINKIVIDYGDVPLFKLIGCTLHSDYSLEPQKVLDEIANQFSILRPETYTFKDISTLLLEVEQWKGKEGVVIYFNNGQSLLKVKSSDYLIKHRFKEHANFETTVDLFFSFGKPAYSEFESELIKKFDWECYQMVRGFVSIICDGYKEVNQIVFSMKQFVKELNVQTRKDAAFKILGAYGNTNRSGYCFKILDNKPLEDEDLKKLLYQVTKNK